MHVEIVEKKVERREFANRETGEVRKIVNQQAYLHLDGQPYPLPFTLSLEEHEDGYEKGEYTFHPSAFSTDKYGKLGFSFNVRLQPAAPKGLKAAS